MYWFNVKHTTHTHMYMPFLSSHNVAGVLRWINTHTHTHNKLPEYWFKTHTHTHAVSGELILKQHTQNGGMLPVHRSTMPGFEGETGKLLNELGVQWCEHREYEYFEYDQVAYALALVSDSHRYRYPRHHTLAHSLSLFFLMQSVESNRRTQCQLSPKNQLST